LLVKIKEKVFYGWVIVAACFVIALILPGIRMSFGVFFKSLEGEFELTRAATSSLYSVYSILCAVFTIAGGWALDRYGPRLVILLMGLFTGLSLFLASYAGSFWQLFLSYSLLLSIGTGAAIPVLMGSVSKWFDKKRGFAVGIVSAGSGLGITIVAPFASFLISNFGWRISFIVMGVVALLFVVSASRLLRRDPDEVGVLPYGAELITDTTEAKGGEKAFQLTGLSLPQAFRTRDFWILLSLWLFPAFCINMVLTHVIPYATDMGISTMKAATVISVMGGVSIPSRVLTGRVSDTVGRKVPCIAGALLMCGALLGLIWARELWMFYLIAVAFGIAWGGIGTTVVAMSIDVFGGRSIGIIMGILDMAYSAGAAIGPLIGGLVYDVNHSYTVSFLIGAALMMGVILLLSLSKR